MRRGSRKTRELGAFAQLWSAQFDRTGAGLPDALPVTVAPGQALGALLAVARPGLALDFQLHRRWAAKPIISRSRSAPGSSLRVRAGSSCRRSSVVTRLRWRVATRSYRRTAGDQRTTARPRRYWGRVRAALLYRATPPSGTRPGVALLKELMSIPWPSSNRNSEVPLTGLTLSKIAEFEKAHAGGD